MKRVLVLLIATLSLTGCLRQEQKTYVFLGNDYGAFLGRSENDVSGFNHYKFVCCELDEFSHANIAQLSKKGARLFAYLNVGSLENYRCYYDDYESFSFKDYDNWPDERWIDVRETTWQDKVIELAQSFKNAGAYGVYMDNIDVYSIAKEDGMDYIAFAHALKNMILRVNVLGLKVMINGGAEFFDDMNEMNDTIFNSVWGYHQEEVFSLITDYELNTFGMQEKEDQQYYQEISKMMKDRGKEIFYLEYTTDNSLKKAIKNYCNSKHYHYYISSTVDLL